MTQKFRIFKVCVVLCKAALQFYGPESYDGLSELTNAPTSPSSALDVFAVLVNATLNQVCSIPICAELARPGAEGVVFCLEVRKDRPDEFEQSPQLLAGLAHCVDGSIEVLIGRNRLQCLVDLFCGDVAHLGRNTTGLLEGIGHDWNPKTRTRNSSDRPACRR